MTTHPIGTTLSRRSLLVGSVGFAASGPLLGGIASAFAAENAGIKVVPVLPEDLSLEPPRFQGNGSPVRLREAWQWGAANWAENKPGNWLTRHWKPQSTDGLRISQLTDDLKVSSEPLTCGKTYAGPLEFMQVKGDPEGASNDPETFEVHSKDSGDFLLRCSSKQSRMIDSGIADLTWHNFPVAIVLTPQSPFRLYYILQFALVEGTLMGRKTKFIGCWDRIYDQGDGRPLLQPEPMPTMVFGSVRADGSWEFGWMVAKPSGGLGIYCEQDKPPVISTDVQLQADWQPVDDKVLNYTKATWSFGGKTINFAAKFGMGGERCPGAPGYKPNRVSGVYWLGDKRPAANPFPWMAYGENYNTPIGSKPPGTTL